MALRGLTTTAGFKARVARLRAWRLFVLFTVLVIFCSKECRAQEPAFDRESYYRAVEYCRGDVSRPTALSPDGKVLCFDGNVTSDLDVSRANNLQEGGLFVVRGSGEAIDRAIALSDLVRERRATVIIYDYCLSACANYFLIASYQTYVLKGALVAWGYDESGDPASLFCTVSVWRWKRIRDGGAKLQRRSCVPASGNQAAYRTALSAQVQFYRERALDPSFEPPADTFYVRKIVRNRWDVYAETGVYHDIRWTIHPRYYSGLFKTKIFYEAYPQSQEEVDGILAGLRQKIKVIYDP